MPSPDSLAGTYTPHFVPILFEVSALLPQIHWKLEEDNTVGLAYCSRGAKNEAIVHCRDFTLQDKEYDEGVWGPALHHIHSMHPRSVMAVLPVKSLGQCILKRFSLVD